MENEGSWAIAPKGAFCNSTDANAVEASSPLCTAMFQARRQSRDSMGQSPSSIKNHCVNDVHRRPFGLMTDERDSKDMSEPTDSALKDCNQRKD